MFNECRGLTSITIPNSVTSIGNGAFSYCSGLTSITIPNSVTSIGNGVFSYCSGLTTINVDSTNSEYRSIDGVLFDKNSTSIIQFPAGKSGNYPIPQTVTSIHDNAFSGCRGVTNITIPNNVTSIGSDAFSSCHSLKNIIIPNSVTNIGEYAFVNCYGLTNITIPNSVASIGARAFYACKGLINFTIPNGLTSINESLFAFCSGLKSITIPSSVTKIGDSAFDRCIELVSVHFLGNAPTTSGGVFSGSEKVVVYFDIEKTGWATSLDGRPTKLWPSYLPAIMIQPLRIKALTSQSGILSIVAEGPAPITYQWHKDGVLLKSETNSILKIVNMDQSSQGFYTATVANRFGSVTSYPAAVIISQVEGGIVGLGANTIGKTHVPAGLTNVVAIQAGSSHNVALRSNGTVVAWGSDNLGQQSHPNYGQSLVPKDLKEITAIAAGGFHTVALRLDGTVVAWGAGKTLTGHPNYGQSIVPPGLSGVIAISAGLYHTVALKNDGTVVAWGAGKNSSTTFPHFGQSSVPFGLKAKTIAAGGYHTLALKVDDTVVAWGVRNGNSWDLGQAKFVSSTRYSMIAAGLFSSMAATGTRVDYWGSSRLRSIPSLFNGFTWSGNRDLLGIAIGEDHALAIRSNGTVVSWGSNYRGQINVPTGLNNVIAVAAGSEHSIALKNDGTLVAWGDNGVDSTYRPDQLNDFIDISVSRQKDVFGHFVGLKKGGSVVAWGNNNSGQTNVPKNLTNVIAISAGGEYTLALRSNGTITAWGDNSYRQTNVPIGLTNVIAIAAGFGHAIALKQNGTVVVWGDNSRGQTNVPIGLNNIISVAAGDAITLAIKDDGTLVVWGDKNSRQTNVPIGLTNVIAVAAGETEVVALLANGKIRTWGYNASAQNDVPNGLSNVVAIATGGQHIVALKKNGTVVAWGDKLFSNPDPYRQAINVERLTNITAIAAGWGCTLAITKQPVIVKQTSGIEAVAQSNVALDVSVGGGAATAYQWYKGNQRISFATNAQLVLNNVKLGDAGNYRVVVSNLSGTVYGSNILVTVKKDNQSIIYNPIPRNVLAGSEIPIDVKTSSKLPVQIKILSGPAEFNEKTSSLLFKGEGVTTLMVYQAGNSNYNSVTQNISNINSIAPSSILTWGKNISGTNNITNDLRDAVDIVAGYDNTMVLRQNGTVLGTGNNDYGKTSIPLDLTGVVAISLGLNHSIALKQNGTITAWGRNQFGQTNIPSGLNDVIAVAAGWNHTLALKGDGTVVGWGRNAEGQTKVPIGLGRVIAVAAGRHHSVALRNDGTLLAWGSGEYEQSVVPSGLKNVKSISAGQYHTLAVTDTGLVTSWGDNSYRQTDVPSGLNGVISVSAGYYHSIALKRDGSIVSWGASRVPLNIPNYNFGQAQNPNSLGGVTAVAAGGYHTVAMTKNPIVKKQPSSLTNLVGSKAVFNVEVESAADLTYQWRKDGLNLVLQNKSYLELVNLKTNQSGKYSVVIMSEYSSVTSSVAVLDVKKISQTISFDKIGDQKLTGVPLLVNAVSSSGLPVEIKIVSGPALVNGNNITLLGLGTVTVVASQSGDQSFNPANGFIQSFNIFESEQLLLNCRIDRDLLSGGFDLTVRVPVNTSIILEKSDDLVTWIEFQKLMGLGVNSPYKISIVDTNSPRGFWRIKRQ